MPSPFPGMDPFLENQEWEDFHTTFNTVLRERLSPAIRPDYLVRVERRVYLEHVGPDTDTFRRADVAVLAQDSGPATGRNDSGKSSETTACTVPVPEERRETYLIIRERTNMEVVTVIELLSPANKRKGGDGRIEYLKKRGEIYSSQSHLVEIDLLRGGERLPVVEPLPDADYFCVVCRAHKRPRAELYSWKLADHLPAIAIPLKYGDDDVILPLQEVFDIVYDRAGYDLSVDYQTKLDPLPSDEVTAWIRSRVSDAAG